MGNEAFQNTSFATASYPNETLELPFGSNDFTIFNTHILPQESLCREATVTQRLVWKRGISKRGILKSLVSHVLNFKSWIKLIYDKITYIYCVINEFNPAFEIQNMGNDCCFWACWLICIKSKNSF